MCLVDARQLSCLLKINKINNQKERRKKKEEKNAYSARLNGSSREVCSGLVATRMRCLYIIIISKKKGGKKNTVLLMLENKRIYKRN